MIKVEFWSDEKLAINCSRDARLLYVGMWNYSDDYGVIKGHPVWLKSQIFPYDDALTLTKFEEFLAELVKLRRIVPFQANGEHYFYIVNFLEHQVISRPSARVNPKPPQGLLDDIKLGLTEGSLKAQGALHEDSRLKGKGEGKGKEKGKNTLYSFTLTGDRKFRIDEEFFNEKQKLYPGVDIMFQFGRMTEWFKNNPKKKKSSEQGIKNFITNWLKKEQDGGQRFLKSGTGKSGLETDMRQCRNPEIPQCGALFDLKTDERCPKCGWRPI